MYPSEIISSNNMVIIFFKWENINNQKFDFTNYVSWLFYIYPSDDSLQSSHLIIVLNEILEMT